MKSEPLNLVEFLSFLFTEGRRKIIDCSMRLKLDDLEEEIISPTEALVLKGLTPRSIYEPFLFVMKKVKGLRSIEIVLENPNDRLWN